MSAQQAILFDGDPGVDDAFALALAARHLEIVGITTVFGNSTIEHTTHNALAIAEHLGLDCPIVSGANEPLASPHEALLEHARFIHGENGMGGARLTTNRTPDGNDAARFIADTLAETGATLVATGPLTNVAEALRRFPELGPRLVVSLMGGTAASGNVTAVAEFNIHADPEATAFVFRSGARITVAPLDITSTFALRESEIERLESGNRLAHELGAAARFYRGRQLERFGRDYTPIHDVSAVVPLIKPNLIRYEDMHVAVECIGEHTRGMTVCDRRSPVVAEPANATLGMQADGDAIVDLLLDAMF